MGLVFDPERVGAGNIPTDADGQAQYDATCVLGESLAELTASPDLLAYMAYGSAATPYRRTATRRSDIDLLVVGNSDSTSKSNQDICARIGAVSAAYNVDVGLIVYDHADLGDHTRVNPFYSSHLSHIRGSAYHSTDQYFSSDFMANAAARKALFDDVPFVDAWPFGVEYLKVRRAAFQEQLDQREADLTALKGPFEAPRNIGRTISDLFDGYILEHTDSYDPQTDDIISPIDRNQPYWQKFLQIADLTGMYGQIGEGIERLHQLDTTYTALLEDTVAGSTSVAAYDAWLRSVYVEALETAFKIADKTDEVVLRIVEMAQLDPTYDQVQFDDQFLIGWYPEGTMRDLEEMMHRSAQIVPVSYDAERLLFRIAPKHPEIARRFAEREESRRRSREQSDRDIVEEWSRQQAEAGN